MPHLMDQQYDARLVLVSVAVATFASYVALDLSARLNAARRSSGSGAERTVWGLGGAVAMGIGIWSMHFIAMLALTLPVPIRYSLTLLIVSALPAIGASGLALFISSRPEVSRRAVLVGAVLMGTGIATMHYTGMAAIVSPVGVHYHSALWWLSVAIAIVASWGALTLAFELRTHEGLWIPRRALAAVVMGCAIAGMHYTGMAAARFPLTSPAVDVETGSAVLATHGLAIAVTAGSCAILGLALCGAAVSIRLRKREEDRRSRTEEMLRGTAGALAVTGQSFFPAALAELMRVLNAQLGAIATVEDGEARTLVMMRGGEVVPNMTVPLGHGLFSHVKSDPGTYCIPEGVSLRAEEPWIRETGAEGYLGIPVRDSDQTLVGMIAIFTPHALHERGQAEPILQIFSTRVAGEMRQTRTDAALRQSEHRLFQSEKIEAVGRLAGGVAHDFNNLLTIILGYGHELRQHVRAEPGASHLEEMVAAADRAKELTRQLLAFSRQQVLQPRPVSLDEIVGSVQSMLRRLIGEDITIVTSAATRGAFVHADPGQLSQVLLNLAVNARDAMPLGGTLSISTQRIVIKHVRHVRLTVTDSGHGMDAATLARIFDPFFSTKGSLGTGLGLATVYGIVRQSGGSISCTSEPGRGTTFIIDFPETDKPVTEPAEPQVIRGPEAPREKGRESLLLVEDEAPVRNFLASVLERRGYQVRTAESASAALAVLKSGWVPHLLITDFVMPGGTSGVELAALATALCPGLRVVLMSGYAKQPEDGPAELQVQAFLQKPFTPDTLDATIRDVLNRNPQA